ncbi:MAG: ethylbenzene dehydrogenase-related protein [Nitrospinota bacterium]
MKFKKYFYNTLIYVILISLLGCSANIESCLEEGSCGPAIEVANVEGNLPTDPFDPYWKGKQAVTTIELGPQMITNPKWPNPSTKQVSIRAITNRKELVIMLEWEDETRDGTFEHSSLYVDRAAVMFPVEAASEAPSITMGEPGVPVNIWQWKSIGGEKGQPGVKEKKALVFHTVEDLNAEGFSTLTFQNQQNVKGTAIWKDNTWRLIFKRRLVNDDMNDVQFRQSVLMAVAVWNGSNKELNGQKGLAGWMLLKFS